MNTKTGGLAGLVVGDTAICTVGKEGLGLTYRGYDIHDLAKYAEFEEVAYLLIYGKLPNSNELSSYKKNLMAYREITQAIKSVHESIPANTHPMDVLRTACSMLGNVEPETHTHTQENI